MLTIVGEVAASVPVIRTGVHDEVASQFPLIGQQLTGNVHRLRRSSVIGLIAGLAAAVWGSTGLAQAGLFTMGQGWKTRPARPGPATWPGPGGRGGSPAGLAPAGTEPP